MGKILKRCQLALLDGTEPTIDYRLLRNRLQPVCKRTLRRQVLEYIKYTKRIAICEEYYPTDNEQKLYELVSAYLQRPLLYALPNSQRQLMTMILRKLLASSTYAIYGTLTRLIERLEDILRQQNAVAEFDATTLDFDGLDDNLDYWVDDEDEESEATTVNGWIVRLIDKLPETFLQTMKSGHFRIEFIMLYFSGPVHFIKFA